MRYKQVILFLLSFLILSCSNNRLKVGFLLSDTASERWERDKDLFSKRINELGGDVFVRIADGDPLLQVEQAKNLLTNENVDVLVVVPVDQLIAAEIVREAHKRKVAVISYDRLIKNSDLDLYVSFDNVEVGKLQAEYLTSIQPNGTYALIGGPVSDNNSFLLRIGQLNVLQPLIDKGDVNVVYDQFVSSWSYEQGYAHMKEVLKTYNNIDAVILANDLLADGAAQALKESELLGEVYIGSQDAALNACQRIVSGHQSMTVYKPIEAIATTAANYAYKLSRKEDISNLNLSVNNGKKMVPAVLLPSMVVNKGTIKMTVVADGYLEENNIFN